MPASEVRGNVLLLGAYSVVGRSIARRLLEDTSCTIVATGRDRAKLHALGATLAHARLSTAPLDATDGPALAAACRGADLVVNCVGPYIVNGREIAGTVVNAHRHYIDFAFEQFHYRRMLELDPVARANGVALVTGAGEVVGLSSIVCRHAIETLGGADTLTVCALEGRSEDHESGFSSIMNGALEPALGNQDYVDGRLVASRMGSEIVKRTFPPPHGEMLLLSDPTIDSLILATKYPVRTMKSYFGMGMEIPLGFFPLMRFLNPYKRRVFYHLASWLVKAIMRRNHRRHVRRGTPVAQVLAVDATRGDVGLAIEFRFRPTFNCTAYVPALAAKMLLGREVSAAGLLTALDLVAPARFFEEMDTHRRRGLVEWSVRPTPAADTWGHARPGSRRGPDDREPRGLPSI